MTETKLHEERATALPSTLDPEAAFAKALDHHVYYDRARDVQTVMEAALHYATQTMSDAIGRLAFQEKTRTGQEPTQSTLGHRLCYVPGPSLRAIDLLLSQEGVSGARLVTVHFKPVLTEEGEAAVKAFQTEAETEMDALGLDKHARFMASIGFGSQKLEAHAKLEAYKASGVGYRPAEAGDAIETIRSTTLNMGKADLVFRGPSWSLRGLFDIPKEIELSETILYKDAFAVGKDGSLRVRSHPEGWWPAIDFEISPAKIYEDEKSLMARAHRSGPRFDAGLIALSHLIKDNGLGPLVVEKNESIGEIPWNTSGVGYFTDLEEAGYAAVCTAGGFFDETVMAHIERFSADIAAQDVAKNVDEWVRTARGLEEKGFSNEKTTFDCNDGRDRAYAYGGSDVVYLFTKTQNGHYRVTVDLGPDDKVLAVFAERQGIRDVGRFVMTENGLRPDYGPSDHRVGIAHTIRNVRDMNGIIGSLSSVSCVFAEEYPSNDEEGMRP